MKTHTNTYIHSPLLIFFPDHQRCVWSFTTHIGFKAKRWERKWRSFVTSIVAGVPDVAVVANFAAYLFWLVYSVLAFSGHPDFLLQGPRNFLQTRGTVCVQCFGIQTGVVRCSCSLLTLSLPLRWIMYLAPFMLVSDPDQVLGCFTGAQNSFLCLSYNLSSLFS
jgi:hypothetical protein